MAFIQSAELMVASRDGEVMRVFSLLNSGASIQTAGGLVCSIVTFEHL